ncbi:T9SS type A sorting domain-containing protein [bacterium SCSIO 12643]|nr:T9SS type A sorting domain-containing protein [bacterium SCSIO 12643]
MRSKLTLIGSLLLLTFSGFSQEVPRKVIVEHFTNTRCSICGSRNPGFFNNFNSANTGNMLHLAIHPSSPYSNCLLNNHDKAANDDRTKYYGVFGGTPRLVINGNPLSASTNYNSSSIFTPYAGLTSPVNLKLYQQKFGSDSIRVRVVLETVAAHSLGAQNLYVVLAEDVVFYNAPNGENQHYNVMRRPLFGTTGMQVNVPATVGDSVVYTTTVTAHQDWDFSRIFALAILQNEGDKVVTQSEALDPSSNSNVTVGIRKLQTSNEYKVYPSPAINNVRIQANTSGQTRYSLMSISGNRVLTGTFNTETVLDVTSLSNGVYFITLENDTETYTQKIIKVSY